MMGRTDIEAHGHIPYMTYEPSNSAPYEEKNIFDLLTYDFTPPTRRRNFAVKNMSAIPPHIP